MEAKKLIACAGRLYPLQAIHLTFNPGNDSVAGLRRLIGLTHSNRAVRIEPAGSEVPLLAVIQDGDWQRVSRTVMVNGLMHAESDLLDQIARDLENVATGKHGASEIFSSKQSRSAEAARQIVALVASPFFVVSHINSWGCILESDLAYLGGLPGLLFTVFSTEDHSKIVEIFLDGFTGRIAVDGKFGDIRYSNPVQLRAVIVDALTEKLEQVTAP